MANERIIKKILEQMENHEKRIHALELYIYPVKKKEMHRQTGTKRSGDLILSIVNKIGECDESEEIQNKVLDQRNSGGKILLCFYISHKHFKNAWLTTGDIERITSGLGTKIAVGNVSNKIKEETRKYLESGSTRKKGQPTPYRLNRKGVKHFEEIIHASKK